MASPDIARLEGIAREGRVQILRMLTHAGPGHPGGSLSVIDLLTVLYFKKILDLEPVVDKWKAFGWTVLEIDGHDLAQIDKALDQAEAVRDTPVFIVAHTVEGKGVSFMENDPEWHGKAPKPPRPSRPSEILGGATPDWAGPIITELSALEKK